MKQLSAFATLLFATSLPAQELYFPPLLGNAWEQADTAELGWCMDQVPALYDFLQESNTKAFIVLKDGRIALEQYFGTFTQDSSWYWASAGKSLTAFMVGMAQQQGALNIEFPSNVYLGPGWSSCTPEQEAAITVRDHLSMTTGLDDTNGEFDCTDPECLTYLTEPGSRWSYYNAPYTLLDGVLEGATGQNLNSYILSNLSTSTGITGLFVQLGYNNVFFSKARSMARFGLLAQNRGTWNGNPILQDEDYFTAMTTPSQSLNPAYGYLWWLNGQQNYLLPGVQLTLPGPLMPDAPSDIYAAMGKNGQIINVSPGTGLVVVRMGNLPDGLFVPNVYNNEIWQHLNAVVCTPTAVEGAKNDDAITLYPNPVRDHVTINLSDGTRAADLRIVDAVGRTILQHTLSGTAAQLDLRALPAGSYRCVLTTTEGRLVKGFVKE